MRTAPDGQTVNIPLLRTCAMEGRRVVCLAGYWIPVGVIRKMRRQIRASGFNAASNSFRDVGVRPDKVDKARFREKLLSFNMCGTVPQTDTGGEVE